MKIVSYNVNGIRAALRKGLVEWIDNHDFDIICFQETKSHPDQVDLQELYDLGYHAFWHSADKKGYSGVLTISRIPIDQSIPGMDNEQYDSEGRVLRTDFGDWTLLNCYFPSGSSSEDRHQYKMEFLDDFYPWVKNLKKDRPNLLIVGDYNIVHTEKDIHNPDRRDNPSGYRPEERTWLDEWFENDFTDVYRHLNPEKIEFSWWSYRAGSRDRNKGWRIDYISVPQAKADQIVSYSSYKDDKHSDHCAICAELDI